MSLRWSRSSRALMLAAAVVASAQGMHGALSTAHLAVEIPLTVPIALIAMALGARAGVFRVPVTATAMTLALIPAATVHSRVDTSSHHAEQVTHAATDALALLPFVVVAAALAWAPVPRLRVRRAVGLGLAVVTVMSTIGSTQVAGASHVAFSQPLRVPSVLTGSDIDIDMREADVPILPGAPTKMWTYNGVFPGPTIRRPSGEQTRVTFTNNLPSAAGEATVHHHGNHSAASEDGPPHEQLIQTGASRTYTYDFMEDGAPERAAFQWYHDHRMDVTGRNVWMGLAGMVILDDPVDTALPLPKGDFDVPLMVADRSFDAGNQLSYAFNPNGVQGTHILVNGVPQPFFNVGDRKYRFRLLNASNLRSYDFALSNGMTMTQIATEGGLLPAPIQRTHIRLAPAERAEVVIDFAGLLGQTVTLRNLFGVNATAQVMQFRVTDDLADDSSVPSTLRPLPELEVGPTSLTRTWVLGAEPEPLVWTINGRTYDPHRVDTAPLNPMLDTTERWVFVNATTAEHVIHIHDVDWRMISRVGPTELDEESTLAEMSLKESFVIRPQETIEIASKFTDHLGRYVLHCHLLEHEDRAMMANFEVVEPLV